MLFFIVFHFFLISNFNSLSNHTDGEDRSLGKISAVLFFVLALQTGLTEISAELRFIRLYRNLCLLLTANLYIIHGMVNPLLFTLSASKNRSLNRHARPLIVCLLLMIFPTWFLVFLWKNNQMSTWLLAVSTFCVEIVIKVDLAYIFLKINSFLLIYFFLQKLNR